MAADDAVSFLKAFDSAGRHHLVAIDPETGYMSGKAVDLGEIDAAASWITHQNAELKRNVYFTVNEPQADCRDKDGKPAIKLAKQHIKYIRAVFADVDPDKDEPLEAERKRLHELADKVMAGPNPASFVIDSGGGVQFFWRLNGDGYASDTFKWAEEQGRGFAHALGGDPVHNIDRIMRLPGTTNYPNAKKRAQGRSEALANLLHTSNAKYDQARLISAVKPMPAAENDTENDARIAEVRSSLDMAAMHELSPELKQKFATAATHHPLLKQLWEGSETGLIGDDRSGSGYRASLAARLCEAGTFTAQEYGQLLHNWDYAVQGGDEASKLTARTISRDWVRIGLPRHPSSWFEVLPEPEVDPFTAYALSDKGREERAEETRDVQFNWIDPKSWDGVEPPIREWEVEGWIPKGEVTLLYGDGGIGKTLCAHQYATCAAAKVKWLGMPTRPARVMAMFCEDGEDELHRRQHDIDRAMGLTPDDYSDNLRIASRKYMDNLLTIWNQHTGEMKRTAVWNALRDDAVRWGATVIIVDTIADTYSGSEIDRVQVNTFVKSCLGRLAQEINGSIIALGHPSMSGMASGSGSSGSTAWSNAARSRLYLRYPKGVESGDYRELAGMKLNYGPKGALLKLKWSHGAFTVTSGNVPGTSGAEFQSIDDVLEDYLREALAQLEVRPLSDKPKNVNYAPRVLQNSYPPLGEFGVEEIEAGLERIGFQPELWFSKFKNSLAAATEAAAASMFDSEGVFD